MNTVPAQVCKMRLDLVAKIRLDLVVKMRLDLVAKMRLDLVAKMRLDLVAKMRLDLVAKMRLDLVAFLDSLYTRGTIFKPRRRQLVLVLCYSFIQFLIKEIPRNIFFSIIFLYIFPL